MVIVKRKELSLSEKLYLPEILRGLSMTLRVMFKKPITRQYPEEPLPTDEVTRGQPRLAVNDDGTIRCVSCGLCEVACPAEGEQLPAARTPVAPVVPGPPSVAPRPPPRAPAAPPAAPPSAPSAARSTPARIRRMPRSPRGTRSRRACAGTRSTS